MNNSKLQSAISAFVKNKKANAAYYDDNWSERKERKYKGVSLTDTLLAPLLFCKLRLNIFTYSVFVI